MPDLSYRHAEETATGVIRTSAWWSNISFASTALRSIPITAFALFTHLFFHSVNIAKEFLGATSLSGFLDDTGVLDTLAIF
jgi:hypothetical protein